MEREEKRHRWVEVQSGRYCVAEIPHSFPLWNGSEINFKFAVGLARCSILLNISQISHLIRRSRSHAHFN